MMEPKRLVLMVEGYGDREAAPVLVTRLLKELHTSKPAFDAVVLDKEPFRIGNYSNIRSSEGKSGNPNFDKWRRYLQAAAKRKNLGGCLLLLDGDCENTLPDQKFCAADAAKLLTAEAQKVGAGKLFSVAVVFACMEFESWLISGIESLKGKSLPDGRKGIPSDLPNNVSVPSDPEKAPRDAKRWLNKVIKGYSPTRDQAALTHIVDLNLIHNSSRSFRRLKSALDVLVNAICSGRHVLSPSP